MKGDSLISLTKAVTKKWTATRKAEERHPSLRHQRSERLYHYRDYEFLTEAVDERMEEAIANASGGGKVEFPKRNLFYAMRALLDGVNTSRPLTASYFDTLIKKYEEENGEIDGMYRDPRGVLIEPHTGKSLPLGTREVGGYAFPDWLFDKLLYVEKKGFGPIFEAYDIPNKYDLAIASSEGYAVNAAKQLMARAEGHQMTVLCLHDADPWGYNICRLLEVEGINVIDLGLHIEEALEMGLPSETFSDVKVPRAVNWSGNQRVELNALAVDPDRFVKWVVGKLDEHGLKAKLIPPKDAILKHAEEERDKRLTEAIENHVKEIIDLDGMVETLAEKFAGKLKLDTLPGRVAKWGDKLKPKRWRDYADGLVQKRVDKIDERLEEAVQEILAEGLKKK